MPEDTTTEGITFTFFKALGFDRLEEEENEEEKIE